MLVLIVDVFRIISLVVASEIEVPFGIIGHRLVPALESVSPHPLSLSIERQGIWNFMLERDEARWLHSNSIREVAHLKACVDYLQATLQVAEEEVAEARALAITALVQEYGKFLVNLNSYC